MSRLVLILDAPVQISAAKPTTESEDYFDFPQYLQENAVMVPKLGHDRFMPNYFTNRPTHLHNKVQDADGIVELRWLIRYRN
jgi:hypothetical protein